MSLADDVLRLWATFPDPQPETEETPALRQRAERLLRWLLEHPGQTAPCSCGDYNCGSSFENIMAKSPCWRHGPGRRKTDEHGRPVSAIFEVREAVDLAACFIEPFAQQLIEQARRDPPEIAIEVSDGFRRQTADHAAIDDIDVLAGRIRLAGLDWKIVHLKNSEGGVSEKPMQLVSGLRAFEPKPDPNGIKPSELRKKRKSAPAAKKMVAWYDQLPERRKSQTAYRLAQEWCEENPSSDGRDQSCYAREVFGNPDFYRGT